MKKTNQPVKAVSYSKRLSLLIAVLACGAAYLHAQPCTFASYEGSDSYAAGTDVVTASLDSNVNKYEVIYNVDQTLIGSEVIESTTPLNTSWTSASLKMDAYVLNCSFYNSGTSSDNMSSTLAVSKATPWTWTGPQNTDPGMTATVTWAGSGHAKAGVVNSVKQTTDIVSGTATAGNESSGDCGLTASGTCPAAYDVKESGVTASATYTQGSQSNSGGITTGKDPGVNVSASSTSGSGTLTAGAQGENYSISKSGGVCLGEYSGGFTVQTSSSATTTASSSATSHYTYLIVYYASADASASADSTLTCSLSNIQIQ